MKRIITIIALQSLLLVASEEDKGRNYIGKKGLKKAAELMKKAPEVAGLAGTEFGDNLADQLIEKMGSEKGRKVVYDLGQTLVEGAAAGAAGIAISAGKAVSAKVTATALAAKTATITGCTLAAPYVAAAAVAGTVGYGSYRVHRSFSGPQEEYTRCLNSNFDCQELNDRGLPKRCDSPERKASNYLWRKEPQEDHFRSHRAKLQAAKAKS